MPPHKQGKWDKVIEDLKAAPGSTKTFEAADNKTIMKLRRAGVVVTLTTTRYQREHYNPHNWFWDIAAYYPADPEAELAAAKAAAHTEFITLNALYKDQAKVDDEYQQLATALHQVQEARDLVRRKITDQQYKLSKANRLVTHLSNTID